MSDDMKIVPVKLTNGAKLYIETPAEEADNQGQAQGQEVSRKKLTELDINDFTQAVEGIAGAVVETLEKIKPKKATVEFGLDVSGETGQLTTLLVKGGGSATMKLTLEWERSESIQNTSGVSEDAGQKSAA